MTIAGTLEGSDSSSCITSSIAGSASNKLLTSAIFSSSQNRYIVVFFFQFKNNLILASKEAAKRVVKREYKVEELALFQLCNQLLEVILGKLACVFFKDGFRCLGRRRVKQNDLGHILPERLCNTGELLGQHPHANACVSSQKAKLDKLSSPPFHIF